MPLRNLGQIDDASVDLGTVMFETMNGILKELRFIRMHLEMLTDMEFKGNVDDG